MVTLLATIWIPTFRRMGAFVPIEIYQKGIAQVAMPFR